MYGWIWTEMNEWIWIRMHIYYFRLFVYFPCWYYCSGLSAIDAESHSITSTPPPQSIFDLKVVKCCEYSRLLAASPLLTSPSVLYLSPCVLAFGFYLIQFNLIFVARNLLDELWKSLTILFQWKKRNFLFFFSFCLLSSEWRSFFMLRRWHHSEYIFLKKQKYVLLSMVSWHRNTFSAMYHVWCHEMNIYTYTIDAHGESRRK